jgi:hypothetical protein
MVGYKLALSFRGSPRGMAGDRFQNDMDQLNVDRRGQKRHKRVIHVLVVLLDFLLLHDFSKVAHDLLGDQELKIGLRATDGSHDHAGQKGGDDGNLVY